MRILRAMNHGHGDSEDDVHDHWDDGGGPLKRLCSQVR